MQYISQWLWLFLFAFSFVSCNQIRDNLNSTESFNTGTENVMYLLSLTTIHLYVTNSVSAINSIFKKLIVVSFMTIDLLNV